MLSEWLSLDVSSSSHQEGGMYESSICNLLLWDANKYIQVC